LNENISSACQSLCAFLDYLSLGFPGSLGQPIARRNHRFILNLQHWQRSYYLSLDDGDKITGVVLQAFDRYYGQRSFIDQVVFRYYPDVASAVAAYQQEDVMGISRVTDDVLPAALEEDSLNIFTGRLPRWGLIYLNLNSPDLPFFQDDQVRSALLMGLNRRWIVDRVLEGQAVIANGPIAPSSWAYYEGAEAVSYDPEGAVALLKEAGYTFPSEGGQVRSKDGVRLEFELAFPDVEPYPSIAQVVQENWQRLGVRVELKPVSYEELVNDYLEPRSYQAALADINLARSPDPDPYPFWHQAQAASGQNYSGWDDRQASEYLEQARVEVNQEDQPVISQFSGALHEPNASFAALLSGVYLWHQRAGAGSQHGAAL
jgi:peptide/nickel transport system substrate-binding protein